MKKINLGYVEIDNLKELLGVCKKATNYKPKDVGIYADDKKTILYISDNKHTDMIGLELANGDEVSNVIISIDDVDIDKLSLIYNNIKNTDKISLELSHKTLYIPETNDKVNVKIKNIENTIGKSNVTKHKINIVKKSIREVDFVLNNNGAVFNGARILISDDKLYGISATTIIEHSLNNAIDDSRKWLIKSFAIKENLYKFLNATKDIFVIVTSNNHYIEFKYENSNILYRMLSSEMNCEENYGGIYSANNESELFVKDIFNQNKKGYKIEFTVEEIKSVKRTIRNIIRSLKKDDYDSICFISNEKTDNRLNIIGLKHKDNTTTELIKTNFEVKNQEIFIAYDIEILDQVLRKLKPRTTDIYYSGTLLPIIFENYLDKYIVMPIRIGDKMDIYINNKIGGFI